MRVLLAAGALDVLWLVSWAEKPPWPGSALGAVGVGQQLQRGSRESSAVVLASLVLSRLLQLKQNLAAGVQVDPAAGSPDEPVVFVG